MFSGKSDQESDPFYDPHRKDDYLPSPDNYGGGNFLPGQSETVGGLPDFSNPFKASTLANDDAGLFQGRGNYAHRSSFHETGDPFGDSQQDFDFQLFSNPAQASQLLDRNQGQSASHGQGKRTLSTSYGTFSGDIGLPEQNRIASNVLEGTATYATPSDDPVGNTALRNTTAQLSSNPELGKEINQQYAQFQYQKQLAGHQIASMQSVQQQMSRGLSQGQQQYSESDKFNSMVNQMNQMQNQALNRTGPQFPGNLTNLHRGMGNNLELGMGAGNNPNMELGNPFLPKGVMSQNKMPEMGMRQFPQQFMPGMMPNPQLLQEKMRLAKAGDPQDIERQNASLRGQDPSGLKANPGEMQQEKSTPNDANQTRKMNLLMQDNPYLSNLQIKGMNPEFLNMPPYNEGAQRQISARAGLNGDQMRLNGINEMNKEILNNIARGMMIPHEIQKMMGIPQNMIGRKPPMMGNLPQNYNQGTRPPQPGSLQQQSSQPMPLQLQASGSQQQQNTSQPGPQTLQQQKSQPQQLTPQQSSQQQQQNPNANTQAELQRKMLMHAKTLPPNQQYRWNPNQDPQTMMPGYGPTANNKTPFPSELDRSLSQGQQLAYSQEMMSNKYLQGKEEAKGGNSKNDNLKYPMDNPQAMLRYQQDPPQPQQLSRMPSDSQKASAQQLMKTPSGGTGQYPQQSLTNKPGEPQNLRGQQQQMPMRFPNDPMNYSMQNPKSYEAQQLHQMGNYPMDPNRFKQQQQYIAAQQLKQQSEAQTQSQGQAPSDARPQPLAQSQSQPQTQNQTQPQSAKQIPYQNPSLMRSRSEGPNAHALNEGMNPMAAPTTSFVNKQAGTNQNSKDQALQPNPQQLEAGGSSQDPAKKYASMQNWPFDPSRPQQFPQNPQTGMPYRGPYPGYNPMNGGGMNKGQNPYLPPELAQNTNRQLPPYATKGGLPSQGQGPSDQYQNKPSGFPTQGGVNPSKMLPGMPSDLPPYMQKQMLGPNQKFIPHPGLPGQMPHSLQNMTQPSPVQDAEIDNLKKLLRSLNIPFSEDSENLNDIRSKLPPDVRKSLSLSLGASQQQSRMQMNSNKMNLFLPQPGAPGNNLPMPRDPKMPDAGYMGYLPNRSLGPYAGPNDMNKNAMVKPPEGLGEKPKIPLEDQMPIENQVKKRQRKSKKGEEDKEEPEKVAKSTTRKPRRKRSPPLSNAEPTPKNEFEIEKPLDSNGFGHVPAEISMKRHDSEPLTKRTAKNKKKKIEDSDEEFDELYGDTDNYLDDDFYEEKKVVKKNRAARMAPTRRSQKLEKVEPLQKKKSSVPPQVSKKSAPKSYSELIKSIALLEHFEWIHEDDQRQLTTKKGKNNTNRILKKMTGSAFWFYICALYFPKAPFVQNTVADLFTSREARLELIEMNFISKVLKTARRLEDKDQEPLTPEELEFFTRISEALKQGRKEIDGAANELYNNLRLEAEMKNNYTSEDDEWILQMRSKLNSFAVVRAGVDCSDNINVIKKFELADLITLLEDEQAKIAEKNTHSLHTLREKAIEGIQREEMFYPKEADLEDALVDLKVKTNEEENYLSFLEKKQMDVNKPAETESKQLNSTKRPKASSEDVACQVCNDGDYTDENLIVFCSKCNVSVHQLCYGISKIPKGDWICDLCKEFGVSGKYMRCPLCSKRSGALKPTVLPATTGMFENVNPQFHKYLSSYFHSLDATRSKGGALSRHSQAYETLKPRLSAEASLNKTHLPQSEPGEENPEKYKQNLYYDYQEESTKSYDDSELQNEPKPAFIWAHIVCVKLIPELFFQDTSNLTKIDGFSSLDLSRFQHECSLCRKSTAGATIQCEKTGCSKYFHPECARRSMLPLETKESDPLTVSEPIGGKKPLYVIYCETHKPLKLRRLLETKDKKEKLEITDFSKAIEKNYQAYLVELRNAQAYANRHQPEQNGMEIENSMATSLRKKKSPNEDPVDPFLKEVEALKKKIPATKHLIYLDRKQEVSTDEATGEQRTQDYYQVADTVVIPNDPNRKLTPKDEIWNHIRYKNFTPSQKYNLYKRLVALGNNVKSMENETESSSSQHISNKIAKSTSSTAHQKAKRGDVKTEEDIPVKKEIQPLKPVADQECGSCKGNMVCNGGYEPMIQCDACRKSYHFRCVGMSVNKTSFSWFCPSCTVDLSAQQFKIEEEMQSINEKIEDQEGLENQGFSISNLNPPDVFMESESSSIGLKERNQLELPFIEKGNQMKNMKSEFEDFFSHDNSGVNPHDSYFS